MSLQSETIESLSNQIFANGAIRFSSIETNQTKKSIRFLFHFLIQFTRIEFL